MKLDLYVPGLLAAPARLIPDLRFPDAPALAEWCARAAARPARPGRFGFIEEMLGVDSAPLAALAWLGATGNAPERQTFFATPVHLQAGMDDLVLFAGLNVGAEERAQLAADIAAFFDGAPAVPHIADELFMQAPRHLAVVTTRLHRAQGERVRGNLPRGADARALHGWMNEAQMFLHDHAVNRARAARGEPVMNGLWFWGEGELPHSPQGRREIVVHADSPLLRGCGRLLGEDHALPASLQEIMPSTHAVVAVEDCLRALDADDVEAWRLAVTAVARDWLAPVLDWLRANADAEAVLHAGDGQARRIRGGRDRLWRRWLRKRAAPEIGVEIPREE